jgi:hypothetical protein
LIRTYTEVFTGRTDYIPLLVNPPCRPLPTPYQLWRDTANSVRAAAAALAPRVAVGADWIPTVNISLFQLVTLPRLYGAEIIEQPGSEPICRRRFAALGEAIDAGSPKAEGPAVEEMLGVLRAAKAALPEGFALSFPMVASPMDLAQLLIGDDFFVAMLDEPEKSLAFLMNLARGAVELIGVVKREMGQGKAEMITNRGMFFPGYRLAADAIVNLPPSLIRDMVLPVLAEFARAVGRLCVHYCSAPAPSAHVLPVLAESPNVAAVDTWQGVDVWIGESAPAAMQPRVALVGDADLSTPEKMDAFLARPPVRLVPRKGGRGIVMATGAPSIDDGRRVYDQWRSRVG